MQIRKPEEIIAAQKQINFFLKTQLQLRQRIFKQD